MRYQCQLPTYIRKTTRDTWDFTEYSGLCSILYSKHAKAQAFLWKKG